MFFSKRLGRFGDDKANMTLHAFILYHPTLVAEKNAPGATFKIR
jgi:hypothetical protein